MTMMAAWFTHCQFRSGLTIVMTSSLAICLALVVVHHSLLVTYQRSSKRRNRSVTHLISLAGAYWEC